MLYGSSYILVIIGAIISGLAALNVKRSFSKYSKIGSARNITGAEAAARILQNAGITDVTIQHIRGNLTDNYNPKDKTLNLSDSVYGSTSIAAIGVAAHECGHAIQDAQSYVPLKFRSIYVPVANIGSKLSWPILLLGMILGFPEIAQMGVWLFFLVVIFQIVTLPVEFNASGRALNILNNLGICGTEELKYTKKVLTAAALTYVAALFTTILQLIRMMAIAGGGNSRRRK